jgi:NAD+ synthase
MSGRTDEDNLGFTYAQLDEYLLNDNYSLSDETISRIDFLHRINKHKVEPMPTFTKEDN